jgi:P27 family predicted phage terminase small subunit
MRGRKPKPTRLRVLEGNPGRRPFNEREPSPPLAALEDVPVEIADNQRAVQEWQRLAPMLRDLRVLTEADRGSLLALCQQWSLYQEATSKIAQAGMVVKSPSGYPIQNPYIGIASKALGHCVKLWAELGCTPSARSRVTTAPDDGMSQGKWEGILA